MKLPSKILHHFRGRRGFTLVELMFAATISVVVLTASTGMYIYILRSWSGIQQRIDADTDLNMAVSRMVYGMDQQKGLRAAQDVSLSTRADGWTLSYKPGLAAASLNSITFSKTDQTLVFNPGDLILGRGISQAEIKIPSPQEIAASAPQPVDIPRSLQIKLVAERQKAGLHVKRELETTIYWRN